MTYLSSAATARRSTALALRALGIGALTIATMATSSHAAKIPQVLLGPTNQPTACVTPGRLMAFVHKRNPALRGRFAKIAVEYMKHGEALNVRWDFAFFQMLLETASLKFTGDVNWRQNNFAGLGATGNGVKGERFRSVSDGVRAHLEHLLIYAGVTVADPIADRTRKVQSWKILAKWQNSIRGPMTFGHIGKKWAPGDRGYASDIQSIARAFFSTTCRGSDPNPELLAEARNGRKQAANQRVADARNPRDTRQSLSARASLGASTVYRRDQAALGQAKPAAQRPMPLPQKSPLANTANKTKSLPGNIKILNKDAAPPANVTSVVKPQSDKQKPTKVASAGSLAAKFATPWLNPAARSNTKDKRAAAPRPAPTPTKCRVWTASYGGQKAIIIKSADTSHVNYTVLDVNAGREGQEAAAYISAYAKGGKKIGEFKSQTLALDKAFKLCPDS